MSQSAGLPARPASAQLAAVSKPFGPLFTRLQKTQDSRLPLQQAVQLAVQIEFATIPTYLAALYSISEPDTRAYQTLRSVVVEEMFHVNQAANLLVAIGGLPKFTGDAVPRYPSYLPHANPLTTPYLGLYRASVDVFENVFAAIETPASAHAPPQADSYDTIAQVYEATLEALRRYTGPEPLFQPNPEGQQRTDIYLGKFGGTPTLVQDMDSAVRAVLEIVKQGEGSVPEASAYNPAQPFGAYNYYGERTDGTYGPIIGTPYEMSHFKKFRSVALEPARFPATYPCASNPRIEDFHNPAAAHAAELFEKAYSIMLDALERTFRKAPGPDPFFTLALPLMHQVLPSLARHLVSTPLQSDGDPSVGPNAAPMFVYRPGCTLKDLGSAIAGAIGGVKQAPQSPARAVSVASLGNALGCVKQLATVGGGPEHD